MRGYSKIKIHKEISSAEEEEEEDEEEEEEEKKRSARRVSSTKRLLLFVPLVRSSQSFTNALVIIMSEEILLHSFSLARGDKKKTVEGVWTTTRPRT